MHPMIVSAGHRAAVIGSRGQARRAQAAAIIAGYGSIKRLSRNRIDFTALFRAPFPSTNASTPSVTGSNDCKICGLSLALQRGYWQSFK
jgi:hypothetical protein